MTDAQTTARFDVIQADRDAVQAVYRTQIERIMAGDRTLDDDKGDDGVLVQAFAAHRHHFAGSLPDGAEAMREACAKVAETWGETDFSSLGETIAREIRALPLAAAPRAFGLGDRVEKISGSSWRGTVVGFYSTTLTPEGYAVESENEPGSVQIYPVKALRALAAASQAGVADGWVMVPREPTEAMLAAYDDAFDDGLHEREGWRGIACLEWSAMLAAAPEPPERFSVEEIAAVLWAADPTNAGRGSWHEWLAYAEPSGTLSHIASQYRAMAEAVRKYAPKPPERFASQEVERLRKALEPFAKACTISTYADADVIDDTLAANKITWGHLRSARAALERTAS